MRRISYLSSIPLAMNPNELSHKENIASNIGIIRRNRRLERSQNTTNRKDLAFPAYSKKSNKPLIRAIAKKCCAYCGTRLSGSTTVVEHFRPKNSLTFKYDELKPHKSGNNKITSKNYGYFKWGDNYKNLLPSCACCNSGHGEFGIYLTKKDTKNRVTDAGAIDDSVMYGKNNFFPIRLTKNTDERENKLYVSSIENEVPLIFNPYLDDPDELFDYRLPYFTSSHFDDSGIKIIPNPNASKLNKLKAIVSINLLGLNRSELCHNRFQKYKTLETLDLEFSKLIVLNIQPVEEWSALADYYRKQFNSDTASFIGFATNFFSDLGEELHEELIHRFPASGLQTTTDLLIILKNFKVFCTNNPYEDYIKRKVNRLQQRRRRQ